VLTVVKWKWGVAYQGRVTARFWEARAWYLTSRRSLSTRLVTRENHDIPTDSRSTVVKPLASPTAICTALLGQRLRRRTHHEPPRAHTCSTACGMDSNNASISFRRCTENKPTMGLLCPIITWTLGTRPVRIKWYASTTGAS